LQDNHKTLPKKDSNIKYFTNLKTALKLSLKRMNCGIKCNKPSAVSHQSSAVSRQPKAESRSPITDHRLPITIFAA